MSPDLSFDWDEWTTASRLGVMSDFKSNLVVVVITSSKLCSTLLLDGWGWWSLSEVNIWVLSDYNGPRLSRLGLTSKSCKNRFHLPQINLEHLFLFLHKSALSYHNVVYHHHDHDQIKRWYVTKVAWTRAGVDMGLFLSLPSHLWKLTSTVCALYSYYSCTIGFFSQLIIASIQSVKIRFHNWL